MISRTVVDAEGKAEGAERERERETKDKREGRERRKPEGGGIAGGRGGTPGQDVQG
jgi:hypothetical protein